jgi:hypothetical protein
VRRQILLSLVLAAAGTAAAVPASSAQDVCVHLIASGTDVPDEARPVEKCTAWTGASQCEEAGTGASERAAVWVGACVPLPPG